MLDKRCDILETVGDSSTPHSIMTGFVFFPFIQVPAIYFNFLLHLPSVPSRPCLPCLHLCLIAKNLRNLSGRNEIIKPQPISYNMLRPLQAGVQIHVRVLNCSHCGITLWMPPSKATCLFFYSVHLTCVGAEFESRSSLFGCHHT